MKKYFKIFLFIFFAGILFNSCKKANFNSIDPNLVGGEWRTYFTNGNVGATVVFSGSDHIEFQDLANGSSKEDDIHAEGDAKYRNGMIIIGDSKFKIVEYPVRFDAIILDDMPDSTHWRMQLKRLGNYGIGESWSTPYTFYRK
ncbi:MAG: hypothetical protein ACXVPU_10140 [Bacteroidia bacterium]